VEYREEREREDQHAQHPTRMSLPGGSTGMPTGLSSGRITHNVKELGKALVRGCVLKCLLFEDWRLWCYFGFRFVWTLLVTLLIVLFSCVLVFLFS